MQTVRDRIREYLEDGEEVVVWADFDEAVIGIGRQFGAPFVIYDRASCIEILINGGLDRAEAEEYFTSSVEGLWSGSSTPIVMEFFDE